ncbi:hypothetical protein K469DRAFT_684145 [Zopfia rhizophila CBS 207.26]|uniref:Uncharacterized protein n=1 Tax=Zopfia rhizophila CBS 207.26 TaxID=1314779 RepID=A0A6A6EFC9_9PEZI|nr:hypothetical protein K469DRAFT_684145 [Zopfia rhizophila CBS 207.26]
MVIGVQTAADTDAAKEKQVSESVIPIIKGKVRDAKCRSRGILFTNLNPLTDSTLKFKPGNPDIYYSACPEQLSQKVCHELSGKIIPSTQHDLPIAPNFFLAAKGPNGTPAVAKLQACYDSTLEARAIHSLQSYKKDEPVYDNKAYTITSTYQDGQLKINGQEWAEKKRNEAIKQANKRANHVEPKASAGDAGASPALSFITTVSETEAYTMSQESRTSLNDDFNTREDFKESDSLIEEFVDYTLPAKRSSKRSKRQRKRRNADVSSGAGHSDESTVIPDSQDSAASNVTTEQSERWLWRNGIFQCHKEQNLVKEQNDTPADVWIYFNQGWPGQGGKKWRL